MDDDDEFFEYIAIPLQHNLRCAFNTDNGQCTNEAEWQMVQNQTRARWNPTCYNHMELTIKQFRTQRQWEDEELEKYVLEKIPTSKLGPNTN